jgi:hypothetical protein
MLLDTNVVGEIIRRFGAIFEIENNLDDITSIGDVHAVYRRWGVDDCNKINGYT